MEIIERIPLIRLQYLATMPFSDFKSLGLCKSSSKNDDDRKQNYNYMISYCKGLIKAKGEMKRVYTYTEVTPNEVGGRLYSGLSIQGISSKIRGFLFNGEATDVDMKNAHPVILRHICKKHNFSCPNLDYYINNRDEILAKFDDDGKIEFLKALNSDKTNKKIKDKFYKDFDKECKDIQQYITKLNDYKHIVETVPTNRTYNWIGSATNRILCVYENKILQEVINFMIRYKKPDSHCCNNQCIDYDDWNIYNNSWCKNCNKSWGDAFWIDAKQIEIAALMFDGLMIYGDYYNNNELLENLQKHISDKFENLNMKFSYKEHKTGIINMPDNFEVGDKKEIPILENSFENISKKFEEQHCKITNKGVFIKQLDNDNIVMSRPHIKTAYEHLMYEKLDKEGNIKHHNFINDWLTNNPNLRCYDEIDVFPKDNMCPPNVFNMWRKFEMEMLSKYTENTEALEFILNHIKILSNNEENVYDYFIKWIAQMIQYPEVKSTCPTLISKEGAGKGTIIRLFEKMFGDSKVYETTNPSRDVWGDFNGRMANTFLINLNELSKKETIESEGKIKGLITDPKITINNKGVNKYDIRSYHRFIISTNNEEPVNTSNDDRRKFIIRCSDELIGNKEYFNTFYEYLDDVNVIKTCFEYFKSIPNMELFNKLELPKTEYQQQLQQLSISPIENWLKQFTYDNEIKEFVELKSETIMELFNEWKLTNEVEYSCNSLKFMVRMGRLNITGVEKHRTNICMKTRFDIPLMKKHFGIGCLL